MSAPLFENLATVEEIAIGLGVAPQTVRNWVAKRAIPHVRVGRRTMFLRTSIAAWLAQREVQS